MSDYSYKHPSNVQLNKGHKHTDDFITKKYILKMLRDPQKLKSLIEEHRATPVGRAATRDHGVIQHSAHKDYEHQLLLYAKQSNDQLSQPSVQDFLQVV